MNDLIPRPGASAPVSLFGVIDCSPPASPGRGNGRSPESRYHIPVRAPAAANDDMACSGGAPSTSFLSLFWLDFVEVEGQVLLSSNFDGNMDTLRELQRESGGRGAERTLNTFFLDELFDTENYAEEMLIAFGKVICKSLRARADRVFPGRSFVTELFSVGAGEGERFGVRLYQEYEGGIAG